ncbi:hypothetical protein R1sor_013969 [Riccia sorocarpa]|uniref:Uncharacterized protein n=1 Tax=Riccia sorocarpa TaxID=122646 RepID=A0ABD3H835_9MARC
MEDTPETVLIAVDTNFDTNLVVIPPRSATIADVREKIKQGHMSLYPSYGSINILAVKVELFNRHYLLEETQLVGQIFREWKGCLHVELAGYPPSSPTASRLRLPLISSGDKAEVSPSKSRKYLLPRAEDLGDRPDSSLEKAQRPVSAPQESSLPLRQISQFSPNRTVASQALEVVGSQKSSDGRNSSERFFRSQDVVQHKSSAPEGQGIEAVEAGLDIALDVLLDVGPDRRVIQEGSTDPATGNNGRVDSTKVTPLGTQASIQSTPRRATASKSSKSQFSTDSKQSGDRKRTGRTGDTANPDLQQKVGESASKKARVRGKSDASSVKFNGSVVVAAPEVAEKTPSDKKADTGALKEPLKETSSDESEPGGIVRRDEVDGTSTHAAKSSLLANAESTKDRTDVNAIQGKSSEKDTGEGRQVAPREPTAAAKALSSGSSSSESSEKRPAKEQIKRKTPNSLPPRRPAPVREESSDDSSSLGASSESYRPDASTGTREVDEVVKNLVNLYSPIKSDEQRGEQSSEASEERQPKGLRNRKSSSGGDEADNVTDNKSRRGSRQTAELNKFQHFIDSQDGLDQLLGLTLSARKSKVTPESEPEPQIQAAARTAKPAPDGLTIDVVPDTQVGISDVNARKEVEDIMQAEKTTEKGQEEAACKPAEGSPAAVSPTGKGERTKSPKSKIRQAAVSVDASDDPLKNFARIASESAGKLGDPLQPKSDDSHQFISAVQLTRLAMVDDDDDAQSDPMQSPKEGSKPDEEKRNKAKADSSVATTAENGLLGTVDKTAEIDPKTSGVATVSANPQQDIPLSHKENAAKVGDDTTGSLPNGHPVAEKPFNDSGAENEMQLRARSEAVARDSRQPEPLGQQMEKERSTEAPGVAELDQSRSELTPGKPMKKKPTIRKTKGGKIAKGKIQKLNMGEKDKDGEDWERSRPDSRTEDAPYAPDSPAQEEIIGGEAQDEPSLIREEKSLEKPGRKKKVKKGVRAAEAAERDETLCPSVIIDIDKLPDIAVDKNDAVSGGVELEQVKVEDFACEKYDTGAAVAPKKRKKKLRNDEDCPAVVSGVVSADEAFEPVKLKRCSSKSNLHPSNPDGDLTNQNGESSAVLERRLEEEQPADGPPVTRKKKKPRRALSVEQVSEVTRAETTGRSNEWKQMTSDVEIVAPVPESVHSKPPPKPRKKRILKHPEQQSTGVDNVGIERKPAEDLEFVEFDSKDDVLDTKPDLFVAGDLTETTTAPDGGEPKELVKRRKKKRVIENDPPSGVQVQSSPAREDVYEWNEEKVTVGAPVEDHVAVKTETPKRKKKKRPSATAEEENDEVLEPSCNQLGYRRGEVSEVDEHVSRKSDMVNDVFRDDKSIDGQSKTRKTRVKSLLNNVENAVSVSSSPLELPGSLATKPRKTKRL